MAEILLAFDDIGLAMPIQHALESAGHTVAWDGKFASGPGDRGTRAALVIVAVTRDLDVIAAQWREQDPVPAVLAMASSEAEQEMANQHRVPSVGSGAGAETIVKAAAYAIAHRFAGGISLAFARGALGIEELGSRNDQIINVIRSSRAAPIELVQEALRWHANDYVATTDMIDMLRDARALQIPEVDFVKLADGSRTVNRLLRAKPLEATHAAGLIWGMASVGAATLTPLPPDQSTQRRRAVIAARDHLVARRERLNGSTYYDVLEILPSSEQPAIDRAVTMLAHRYSPDVLGAIDLGHLTPLALPLWQQIVQARAALLDYSTRGKYHDWLRSQRGLKSTWVNSDIDTEQAEESFLRGQEALVEGDVFRALGDFASAARAHPDHPDYEASLAWARFRAEITRGKDRDETAAKERAVAEAAIAGRQPWPRALVALGLLCSSTGDAEAARWHLKEALRVAPNLPAAKRILERLGEAT